MRLEEFIGSIDARVHQGTLRTARPTPEEPDLTQVILDGLAQVRKTNAGYFRLYWALLLGTFVVVLVLAIVFREQMGGIAAVLGSGGVIQGGLLRQISMEWREKSRIETVAVLASTLKGKELLAITKELLAGVPKH
jgi:hypothetical protein